MISQKLLNILRSFSKNEFNEFEKFIGSSFFNKGRNYTPFLAVLKKFHPKFDDDKLTQEFIFQKLYPGKKFNKQMIWNTTSSLQNMAEEFLIYVSLGKNKFLKSSLLANEFLSRNMASYQARKLDEMEKALEKTGINYEYFRYKNELENGRMNYHFLEDTQHLLSKHITKKGEYAILNVLRDLSAVINDINANAFMFNAKFDVNIPRKFIESLDMESILIYAKEHNYEDTEIMEMLHSAIMTILDTDDPKHFFRLKELFEKNIDRFSDGEKLSWITTLSNYCTIKSNKGDTGYRSTLFEINKLELEVGYAPNSKHISKILYIQMIRNALSINETGWVHTFIEEYTQRLKASYQKPMRALGSAYLYQKLKDYPKVLSNLKDVKFIDARDKMYVKSIYIRTYFEQREFELLRYQIDSTKHFLNTSTSISKTTRENMIRFLNFMSSLINAIERNDDTEIEMIRRQVENDAELPFDEWMLIKIAELQNKKIKGA